MAYSSDHDDSYRAAIRRPDPFASLPADEAHRERSWLFNLLMSPFKDHDERATYRLAGQVSDAKNRAGIRVSKAWHGNGAPSAAVGSRFSSVDRQSAGH